MIGSHKNDFMLTYILQSVIIKTQEGATSVVTPYSKIVAK